MGRTSIAPCSAPGILRRVLDRLVHRLAFEEEVAAERLLHLCVRPVGHERLAVANADGRRVARGRELRSADHDAGLARFVRERAVLRVYGFPLVGGERVPAGCIAVDQCHELHALSFHVGFHTTTICWPPRSTAPGSAARRPKASARAGSSPRPCRASRSGSRTSGSARTTGSRSCTGSAGAGASCPRPSPRSSRTRAR